MDDALQRAGAGRRAYPYAGSSPGNRETAAGSATASWRSTAPTPLTRYPLPCSCRSPGRGGRPGDGFAGGKELAALDEHQVRSWTSWHRWTILALLAHAFLSVLAGQAAASHPDDEQLIPLTRHEIRRLLTGLSRQLAAPAAQLHWSRWRRRHQATARTVTTADEPKHPHDHELSLEY